MKISLVVAAAENNAIGKDNKLLWHLPNDMKFFKNTTWGMPVIMGRRTFESMAGPLSGRTNIVVTRQADWQAMDTLVAKSLPEAIEAAATTDAKEAYVIGGGEIYRQAIDLADEIVITRVHAVFDGDTFFPEIREGGWELVSGKDFKTDEKHAYAYSFQIWKRK